MAKLSRPKLQARRAGPCCAALAESRASSQSNPPRISERYRSAGRSLRSKFIHLARSVGLVAVLRSAEMLIRPTKVTSSHPISQFWSKVHSKKATINLTSLRALKIFFSEYQEAEGFQDGWLTCGGRGGWTWAERPHQHAPRNRVCRLSRPDRRTKNHLSPDHRLAICRFFRSIPSN